MAGRPCFQHRNSHEKEWKSRQGHKWSGPAKSSGGCKHKPDGGERRSASEGVEQTSFLRVDVSAH